jgi:hypothetical protein
MTVRKFASLVIISIGLSFAVSGHASDPAPAAPAFNTVAGTYYAPLTISITDASSCASVYYATNGATPTASSTLYSGAISISKTTTLKAVAVCSGETASAVTSVTYTISAPPAPTLSVAGGNFYAPQTVSLADGAACGAIYYTLNGSSPTTASTRYAGPITLSSTESIEAIAACAGGSQSKTVGALYHILTPDEPSLSLASETSYVPLSVSIADDIACAAIYYTLNGITPTAASTRYTGPISVAMTSTLEAAAICPGGSPSAVRTATYKISAPNEPAFSNGSGTYYMPTSVSITELTACASVYYTLNGSIPTPSSTKYSGPITVTSTATLNAVAICPGGSPSVVGSETYTISPPSKPNFSLGGGTYYAPLSVSINEPTACASVYYTVNGATPTSSSIKYSGSIAVNSTTTLNAVAICPGGSPSAVSSDAYTLKAPAAPVIWTASGLFQGSASVTISESTPGAVIHYTTSGAAPSSSSAVYSGAIQLSNTATFSTTITLNAVAVYPSGFSSPVASAQYTILSGTTPIKSVNMTSSFFGMDVTHLFGETPWPEVPVGTLRLWDSNTMWSDLNPARGKYNWTNLDKQIAMAQNNGAQVLYTLGVTPSWAIPAKLGITSIARAGSVVTVTTTSPHGLYYNSEYGASTQSTVIVSGVKDPSYDGTFMLTGTPTPTTLTYAQTGPNSTSSAGTLSAGCDGNYAPTGCAEAPASVADWDAYVTALVDHAGRGVIQYWELWNEANLPVTWLGDPKVMVAMSTDAYKIIKAADPNAIVLSPSSTIALELPSQCTVNCASMWLNNFLATGGAAAIDGVAFHAYPMTGVAPEQVQQQASLMQETMVANGVGSMPLIDTESSWGKNMTLPAEADQVAFLERHLLLEQSIGIQLSVWYAYDNGGWGTMWSSAEGVNSIGAAYKRVAEWTAGAKLTQPCAPTAANPGIYTCAYSRPDGYSAIAVWNTLGTSTFAVPKGYVHMQDSFGGNEPVSGSVTIGTSPILLETSDIP